MEELGFVKAACGCVPGLLIPMLRADGSAWGYQYRPDIPRWLRDRQVKYETPYQQRNGLDIPPGKERPDRRPERAAMGDRGGEEGRLRRALQMCVVAVSGVWNWRGTNDMGGKTAVGDWNEIALNGRRVILAFDGDVARKKSVAKALCALAEFLKSRGAKVEYLHLPDTDEKTGLDDYLVAGHTIDDLWKLVKPNQPPIRDRPEEPPPEPPRGSHRRSAASTGQPCWRICAPGSRGSSWWWLQADLRLLALWVVHTFLCHELYTTPRLLIDSIAPGSGKTTLLEHLDHLCRNAMLAVTMSSAALIPRILAKEPRTVLLDEIQRTLVEGKPEVDEVVAMIGSGYRRGATARCWCPRDATGWSRLPTFAPVAWRATPRTCPRTPSTGRSASC